jgi:formylmethanofuran dehydrogenase subunit E
VTRCILLFVLFGLPTMTNAAERLDQLPQPEYHRQPTDPAWLATVVQFHGHLGPAVVAGARMGMIGLRAVEAKGYFDVEVTCAGPLAKPPQACFLDGIQVATGATLGKRTLHWVQADRILVRVTNARTGRTAELRPMPALMDLLAAFKSQPKTGAGHGTRADEEQLEALARKIATLPEQDVASVTTAGGT